MTIRETEIQLKAVANARRLVILRTLKESKTLTVGEIAKSVKLGIAPTSQHLRILKAAKIVEYKRRGKFITYRLALKQSGIIQHILADL